MSSNKPNEKLPTDSDNMPHISRHVTTNISAERADQTTARSWRDILKSSPHTFIAIRQKLIITPSHTRTLCQVSISQSLSSKNPPPKPLNPCAELSGNPPLKENYLSPIVHVHWATYSILYFTYQLSFWLLVCRRRHGNDRPVSSLTH